MGDDSDFRAPDRWQSREPMDAHDVETELSKQSLQEIAHDRGRICKKRGCVVCAPLVERRREKKRQRKAEARAQLHAQRQPCGGSRCSVVVCVAARDGAAPSATTSPGEPSTHGDPRAAEAADDSELMLRRQKERHRVDLPCGSQDCPRQVCIDGFANERTRRHRARRPCRSDTCDNLICVTSRSSH